MARLEVKWLPAVGAARYEVREQGTGNTPIERYENGIPLGPRVDSTRFVFGSAENRDYHLSVRAYNRAGVASPEPSEFTVTTGGENDVVRMPTDINLLSYYSFDEKYDQTGETMEPQLFSFPDGPFPVGTAEHGRRMRYDQGFAQNHLIIQDDTSPAFKTGAKVVRGPSNSAYDAGDTVVGTPLERWNTNFSDYMLIVDERVSPGGQTDLDLVENFTICGWLNPCFAWPVGFSWGFGIGQANIMASRFGRTSVDQNSWIGWSFNGCGGPTFWGSGTGAKNPDGSDQMIQWDLPAVNGIGFSYVSTLNNNDGFWPTTHWHFENAGWGLHWPYPFEQSLDIKATGLPWPQEEFTDGGEYMGWHFVALRVGPGIGTGTDATCDFTAFVGRADRDDFHSLGTRIAPRIYHDLWNQVFDGSILPLQVNELNTDFFAEVIDDYTIQAQYAMYDELRIYNRPLDDAELRALYYHPGGQKRTENLVEPERQILQP